MISNIFLINHPFGSCLIYPSIYYSFMQKLIEKLSAIAMSTRQVSISIFFFLFLIIPVTFSLSFDMSPIKNSDVGRFNTTGDANVTNDGIQLTRTNRSKDIYDYRAGRATYVVPLHLWDKATRSLADFSTHFSFVIASNDKYYGDGLAFFLAPVGSSIKPWSYGGGLGLGNNSTPVDSSSLEAFVAVEFDTFSNLLVDLAPGPHVGIDINSMSSVNSTTWDNNITEGMQNDARISYNASSKMLRVDFTGHSGNRTQQGNLSYGVDLRDYLPEYVTVGFSASTGAWFERHNVVSWNFSSTLQLNVSSNEPTVNRNELIVGLSVGLSIVILASAFAFYCLWRKKSKELGGEDYFNSSTDNEFERGTGPKKFSYSELAFATNNFAEEAKLGEGGFGGVYRGFLRETNSYVAVKRVSKGSKQGRKEYASEVRIISQLRHINLVQLIGWCHERAGELLLVYEFMPNGSLDSHLFKAISSPLSWELRCRIAQGLASALLYLHEELKQYVVHRDIKASNIMLDSNFNAKLGDFGLARLVDHDKRSKTTIPAGTIGYMAPEYPGTGRASKESDIYSFGIVLLEIACGRRPIDHRCPENQVILVEWVWGLYGAGRLLDAVDPKLDSNYDAQKIEQLMIVGLWCVHPDSSQRPSIRQAMQVLNSEAPWPTLPHEMPVAMYNAPPTITATGSSNAHLGGVFSTDSVIYSHCSNTSNLTMPR